MSTQRKIMNESRCLDAEGYKICTGDFIEQSFYKQANTNNYIFQVDRIVAESNISVKVTDQKSNIYYFISLDTRHVHIIGLSAREHLERQMKSVTTGKNNAMRASKTF